MKTVQQLSRGGKLSFTVTAGAVERCRATTSTTDANGQALPPRLTLGSQPGPNTVAAAVEGLEPVTFTATAIGQDQTPVETGEDDGEEDDGEEDGGEEDSELAFGFAGEVEDQAYTAGTAIRRAATAGSYRR